jgi:hypothetical protein
LKNTAPTRLVASLVALLALSLAGNIVLLFRAGTASAVRRDEIMSATTTARDADVDSSSPEAAAALSRAFAADDLRAFRSLLEAAGVEPRLRRQLLQVALSHRYEARFRDTVFPYGELMRRDWWRDPVMEEYHPAGLAAKRREEESLALAKRFHAELAELLGEDLQRLDLEDPDNGWLARRFSGLPKDKAEALHRIERDYQELTQEIQARAGAFLLPSDTEKLRLLKEEQERDIAALLSPEERAEWELRASPTADRARHHATRYRATEEEYRRIYALQKTFDDAFDFDPFTHEERPELDWRDRHEAEKSLHAAIRAIVGDERHAEALRRQSLDFTLATAAASRLGLPADTAERLYALRHPAATRSQQIAQDPSLTPAEKNAALARLAADTRDQLRGTLGDEAASAYLERGGMGWLRSLDQGVPIQFDPDNGSHAAFQPAIQAPPSSTFAPHVPLISVE